MKKIIFTFYVLLVGFVFSFSLLFPYSTTKGSNIAFRVTRANDDELIMLDSALSDAHAMVEKHNTDFITVFENMKYECSQLLTTTGNHEYEDEINYYDEAIANYQEYLKIKNTSQRNWFIDVLHKAGIDLIVAGFKLENWDLSAELLSKMRFNKVPNSEFYPRNGDVLSMTEEITNRIAKTDQVVGSGEFNSGGNWGYVPVISHEDKFEIDAHYALNKFTYCKKIVNDRVLVDVFDRFDFDANSSNILVQLCYSAQEKGLLTPFYAVINDIEVNGSVMFNHAVENDEIVVTKHGNVDVCNIPDIIGKFKYKSETDNFMPDTKVTKISDGAFKNDSNLKEIKLPIYLKYIGNSAFENCTNLNLITIPKNVTYVGARAFANCPNLTIQVENKNATANWDENWNVSNCKVVYLKCDHNYVYDGISNSQHMTTCTLCDYYSLDPHVAKSTYKIGPRTYADCILCKRQVDLTNAFVIDQITSVNRQDDKLFDNNEQYYKDTIVLSNGVIILGEDDLRLFLLGELEF